MSGLTIKNRSLQLQKKGLKIVTPSKLLTRLPILLAQIKAGNNSYKLKMTPNTVSLVSA